MLGAPNTLTITRQTTVAQGASGDDAVTTATVAADVPYFRGKPRPSMVEYFRQQGVQVDLVLTVESDTGARRGDVATLSDGTACIVELNDNVGEQSLAWMLYCRAIGPH